MWFHEEEEEEEEEEKKEKKGIFRVYVKNSNLGVTAFFLTDSFLHSSALFPVALCTRAHTSWLRFS